MKVCTEQPKTPKTYYRNLKRGDVFTFGVEASPRMKIRNGFVSLNGEYWLNAPSASLVIRYPDACVTLGELETTP